MTQVYAVTRTVHYECKKGGECRLVHGAMLRGADPADELGVFVPSFVDRARCNTNAGCRGNPEKRCVTLTEDGRPTNPHECADTSVCTRGVCSGFCTDDGSPGLEAETDLDLEFSRCETHDDCNPERVPGKPMCKRCIIEPSLQDLQSGRPAQYQRCNYYTPGVGNARNYCEDGQCHSPGMRNNGG